jgi:glutamate synthase domain-containing protein 1
MCGIVGLFAKQPEVEERLGAHLGAMLIQLANRGPDSAGLAIYRDGKMEIYKEAIDPREFVERFDVASMSGSHGLGHTRMATESRVTTEGAHPFSTGGEVCLVHNGSLSNHNALRRRLRHEGIAFQTENDTEVAAGYLEWRLREGDTLQAALEACLVDLDGFYTFAVGTADGFAVLRDPIACKPAVMAENDEWVAMASEYRAIAVLPGADAAEVWEPEPGRVYSWERGGDREASPAARRLAETGV